MNAPVHDNAPALIEQSPLVARYRESLSDRAPVNEQTPLIPARAAAAIIEQVDRFMATRASKRESDQLVARLLGAYRRADYHDIDTFIDLTSEAFSEYPRAVGAAAVKQLVRTMKFPPTTAEVVTALDEARAVPLGWRWRALKHLEESRRREAVASPKGGAVSRNDVDRVLAEFRKKSDRLSGDPGPGREEGEVLTRGAAGEEASHAGR